MEILPTMNLTEHKQKLCKLYIQRFGSQSFSTKSDIRKKIEDTKFEGGNTMTAMAMKLALNSFKQQQRKNKDTARV